MAFTFEKEYHYNRLKFYIEKGISNKEEFQKMIRKYANIGRISRKQEKELNAKLEV